MPSPTRPPLLFLLLGLLLGVCAPAAAAVPQWTESTVFDLGPGALPGPGLLDLDQAFERTSEGALRRDAVVAGRRYLLSERTDLHRGSWDFFVELEVLPGAPGDAVYFGLGRGRPGPHEFEPDDSLVLRLHLGGVDGNGTGRRVELVWFGQSGEIRRIDVLGQLPPPVEADGRMALRLDINKIGPQLTFTAKTANGNLARTVGDVRETPVLPGDGATQAFIGHATRGILLRRVALEAVAPPAPAPTLQFSFDPQPARAGEPVQLRWEAWDARDCVASGDWSGPLPVAGSQLSAPLYKRDNRFTIRCHGEEEDRSATLAITAEGGRAALTPLFEAQPGMEGLDPEVGQRHVQLVALRSGRTVVGYTSGYTQGCRLFGPCAPRSSAWHLVLDREGLRAPPRLTWPELETLPDIHNYSPGAIGGSPAADGATALLGLSHSGHNALGGRFVAVNAAGEVIARRGGTGSYGRGLCRLGRDVLVPSLWVDPTTYGYQLWAGGTALTRTGVFSFLESGGQESLVCADSAALGGPAAVILQSHSAGSHVALQLLRPGPEGLQALEGRARIVFAEGSRPILSSWMALHKDRGVVVLRERTRSGRLALRLARFLVTASGLVLVDRETRPLAPSLDEEGLAAAVTPGEDGLFYVASYHGGRSEPGQPVNQQQSLRVHALDFASGELRELVPPWSDGRWSGTPPLDFYGDDMNPRPISLALSCDGGLYLGAAVDGGRGRSVLKVFRIPIGAAACDNAPRITPQVSGDLGNAGWYTGDVRLNWQIDLLGARELERRGCEPVLLVRDTPGETFHCELRSTAGTLRRSITLRRDATPPTARMVVSPLPNAEGWHAGPVTVRFQGEDAGSGVADCSAADAVVAEGDNQFSVQGHCTDAAGNRSAPVQARGLRIDHTPPSVQAQTSEAPEASGWHRAPVTVVFVGEDALSGVAPGDCDDPRLFNRSGAGQSAAGRCHDRAGNVGWGRLDGLALDLSAPLVAAHVSPAANTAGWHNTPVTVRFEGADRMSGSGIQSCTRPVTLRQDGTGRSVTGHCTDKAGHNSEEVRVSVYLDQQAPVIALQAPRDGARYVRGSVVPVRYQCSDERSGLESCRGTVANGTPLDTRRSGRFTLEVLARDVAGNTRRATVRYEVSD